MSEPNGNGSARRTMETILAVMSVIGGGSGIYAIAAAKDYGSLVQRVSNLEQLEAERRQRATANLADYINLKERVLYLESEIKRLRPGGR